MLFKFVSDIEAENPQSWDNSTFLTFDTDWAHEDYVNYTLDLLTNFQRKSTWFITNDFLNKPKLLSRLENDSNIEIGIHPNFNPSLLGHEGYQASVEKILQQLLDIVPTAKSVRSHSLCQNTRMSDIFAEYGLTHECNDFVPWESGIKLGAFKMPNGITRAPHFWEDDIAANAGLPFDDSSIFTETSGLKIFDFHPIHVFLNMENMELYEDSREIHYVPEELEKIRREGPGTESLLLQILTS